MKVTPNKILTPCTLDDNGILLIVEDDVVVLEVVKHVIAREEIPYVIAGTGKEALKIINDSKLNVRAIVTDAILPDISGIGLARSVHEKDNTVPFLFCTGSSDPSASNIMWQHGLVYNKPIEEDFPAALRRLIMCAEESNKASSDGKERRVFKRRDSDVIK